MGVGQEYNYRTKKRYAAKTYELNLDIDFWITLWTVNGISFHCLDNRCYVKHFFLYMASEKCVGMSGHSEKYPSSSFIHHVP